MTRQYQRIAGEDINTVAEHDPQRALLMCLANSTLAKAEERATGEKPHQPELHKSGWSIAVETPQGVVGLWSCWLDNQFYLGYPKRTSFLVASLPDETVIVIANKLRVEHPDQFLLPSKEAFNLKDSRQVLVSMKDPELLALLRHCGAEIPQFRDNAEIVDRLIMQTLDVELAKPVLQVDATAVSEEDYEGEYKDPDKPLVRNGAGQIVAYKTRAKRLWAKFYGPRVSQDRGRVWVDHSDFNPNGHSFDVVNENSADGLEGTYYGHSMSRGIFTTQFSFWSEYAPDGPTTEPAVIQTYRDKFITLLCEIAKRMGGTKAVNIDYGFVLVPEQLEQLGYENISWLKGRLGYRKDWGKDVVRAEKPTDAGKEMVVLKSGNSLVPWSTIRRIPYDFDLDVAKLIGLLTF